MPRHTLPRPAHWLRPRRKVRRPENLIFVDTEARIEPLDTLRSVHSLRLGQAAFCRYATSDGLSVAERLRFDHASEFWVWADGWADVVGLVYIVAHNMEYDARLLAALVELPALGYAPEYIVLTKGSCFFIFSYGCKKIVLLDNANYWRVGLDTLGREFSIPKMSIDFDAATDDELAAYCKRDVDILIAVWSYWLAFLDEHDLGDFGITAATQAWNAYRYRFMPGEIGIHNNLKAIQLERAAYHGGRVEVFQVGEFQGGPFYKLDVNGLYAWAMQQFPHPQKLVKSVYNVTPEYLDQLLGRFLVCADVIVHTDEPFYPVRSRGFSHYPVGRFRCQLTTPEIRHALDKGNLIAIGQVALYEPGDIFGAYVGELSPLRERYRRSGDRARYLICKLLLNGLQGKFGQRGYHQQIVGKADPDILDVRRWIDGETGEVCEDWTIGGVIVRQFREGEGGDSFPAIPAHTAAYGRSRMWDLIQRAGVDHCFYSDTDSLIVDGSGFMALQSECDPIALGKLKLEGIARSVEVQAKKSYVFGDRHVVKGIKPTAESLGENVYQQWHFTSLRWAIQSQQPDSVMTYQVKKHIKNVVRHGMIGPGGQVSPGQVWMTTDQIALVTRKERSHSWNWWVSASVLSGSDRAAALLGLRSARRSQSSFSAGRSAPVVSGVGLDS